MAEAQASEQRPLDDVMLAMDVVDTLRHRELLVERELHAEDRDQKLLVRLRELYAAQGIAVPDHVLQEGVRALRENRFTYKPPQPGLAVTLARLYINRGTWAKGLLAIVVVVAAIWLGYTLLISGPRQRRLAAIPRELTARGQAIVHEAKAAEVKMRAEQLTAQGQTALHTGNTSAAEGALSDLKALRAQLEQEQEARFRQLMDEKAAYAAGEDELCRQAISTLVGQFEREGLLSLRRQAEATRTPEDDRLVQELAGIDQQHKALEATLAQHKQLHSSQIERLQQLEEVRRRFKRERYDDVHSSFTNTALLAMIMNQFLRGSTSSDTLWDTMHRHQRYRRIESDPGFGSGGFDRPGGVWRFPSSSGGFGGGDFRSGGGFGGGDFQTRGGF